MPEVLNRRKLFESPPYLPHNAVYVGRGTKWGNPYIIGQDGDRAEVIRKYEELLLATPDLLDQISELKGKDLVCWCAPLWCHADVLLELANKE